MNSHAIQRLCASARSLLRFVVAISAAILVACGSSPAPNDPATATNSAPTTTPETTVNVGAPSCDYQDKRTCVW